MTVTDRAEIASTVSVPLAWQVWLDDQGILHVIEHLRIEMGLEDAKERVSAMAIAGRGGRRPLLVNLTHVKGMTREARLYFSGPESGRVVSAAALIVGSPLTRAIGTFFMGLNRSVSSMPTKLFSDEATAITWLRSFL